jgi:rhodanese-related sulfurtransferase
VAEELGYRNVQDYRGGVAEWAEAGLPVAGSEAGQKPAQAH